MPPAIECVPGTRFGSLTVVGEAPTEVTQWRTWRRWLLRCDCGRAVIKRVPEIRARRAVCRDCAVAGNLKHGEARNGRQSAEYFVWTSMRSRCRSPKDKAYPHYGGRGIQVCERWNDFSNFLADMGRRPRKGMELDRINNDGNYEPGNCRWVTSVENGRNKRSNRKITHNGETLCLTEWAQRATWGSQAGAENRIRMGYPMEVCLTLPKQKPGAVIDESVDKRKRIRRGK